MTRQELMEYVRDRFSVEPDYPWEKIEDGYVFRHQASRKWFGVGLTVSYRRLGIEREGTVDIVDFKAGPLLQGAYLSHPGVLPGYHMNKTHWLTVFLDGTTEDAVIAELLDVSYELTREKPKSRQT